MTEDPITSFERTVLKGAAAPYDLSVLVRLQAERNANGDRDDNPLDALDCRILSPGETHPLLDHSYLDEKERANGDIMSNIAAFDAVTSHCTFVAVNYNDELFGYWCGPEDIALADAPIVSFDSEGQFRLMQGSTMTEALIGDYVFDEDDKFAEFRTAFAMHGIDIQADNWDALATPEAPTRPEALHLRIYNDERVKRGLPPIE